jgi:hypothetical protein
MSHSAHSSSIFRAARATKPEQAECARGQMHHRCRSNSSAEFNVGLDDGIRCSGVLYAASARDLGKESATSACSQDSWIGHAMAKIELVQFTAVRHFHRCAAHFRMCAATGGLGFSLTASRHLPFAPTSIDNNNEKNEASIKTFLLAGIELFY